MSSTVLRRDYLILRSPRDDDRSYLLCRVERLTAAVANLVGILHEVDQISLDAKHRISPPVGEEWWWISRSYLDGDRLDTALRERTGHGLFGTAQELTAFVGQFLKPGVQAFGIYPVGFWVHNGRSRSFAEELRDPEHALAALEAGA